MTSTSPRAGLVPALVLALVAGYVDAFAFMKFQVYASFMSGNTTQTGLQAGNASASAWWCAAPIPAFVAGVIAATLILAAGTRVPWLLIAVAGLLAVSQTAMTEPLVALVALAAAMGMMNTTITRVGGEAISLGYVSGGLNNLGQHIAMVLRGVPLPDPQHPGDSHARRALLLASMWAAFISGAASAAVVGNGLSRPIVSPAIVIVALTAVLFPREKERTVIIGVGRAD
jgi:uncharacterized membrane protein YoaK (UPF0700 family)